MSMSVTPTLVRTLELALTAVESSPVSACQVSLVSLDDWLLVSVGDG